MSFVPTSRTTVVLVGFVSSDCAHDMALAMSMASIYSVLNGRFVFCSS